MAFHVHAFFMHSCIYDYLVAVANCYTSVDGGYVSREGC